MGLPDPTDVAAYDTLLAATTVGGPEPLAGAIELRDYDPAWPTVYAREAAKVKAALGERALALEHVGSTSVPELTAKPIIDIVLEVADPADEAAYAPALEAAGYALRIREPAWFEHRMFHGVDPAVNLHVFPAGCPETERMVRFRDRLRADAADRDLYAQVKRELAMRDWKYVQQYADAKAGVIEEIVRRAGAG